MSSSSQSPFPAYALGFVFSEDGNSVMLLEKRRGPPGARGWNGVGGHVEPGETPLEAMVRECMEESGVIVPQDKWIHMGNLAEDSSYSLDVFTAVGDISQATSKTDEIVQVFARSHLSQDDLTGLTRNLLAKWLGGGGPPLVGLSSPSPGRPKCP